MSVAVKLVRENITSFRTPGFVFSAKGEGVITFRVIRVTATRAFLKELPACSSAPIFEVGEMIGMFGSEYFIDLDTSDPYAGLVRKRDAHGREYGLPCIPK